MIWAGQTEVVGTTTKTDFMFQQLLLEQLLQQGLLEQLFQQLLLEQGTTMKQMFGTAVPTIIVLTAYYWKSCIQRLVDHCYGRH